VGAAAVGRLLPAGPGAVAPERRGAGPACPLVTLVANTATLLLFTASRSRPGAWPNRADFPLRGATGPNQPHLRAGGGLPVRTPSGLGTAGL